ncbi:Cardiolipin synthetase [Lachnospiraceae bacterium TWA4]|nr:Cardiolipin synthetase [Lachnospiraceae bacterium TWA4]
MKKIVKRILAILPAVLLQGLWFFVLIQWFTPWATGINFVLSILSVIFILYIATKEDDGTYKILWLIAIMGLPILGTVIYLMFGNKRTTKSLDKKLKKVTPEVLKISGSSDLQEIEDERLRQTFSYMETVTGFPVKKNEIAKYYSLGEDLHRDLLTELKKAEQFIFIEYFIIEHGYMWDSIVDILEEKVKHGVDVRVMYDDFGSLSTYSLEELKSLQKKGIKCIPFNQLRLISGTLNYRDHRKMTIIDGKTAFSGGVNIADEYINHRVRFGHWKDIGFCIKGEAVCNYTRMFVEFWDAFAGEPVPKQLYQTVDFSSQKSNDGYIFSYYDSPIRRENTSNELYIELLAQARHTAYFYTPYLMMGDALLDAFKMAARRGVDVRIIMPGIPDKKLVFRMSRSFYFPLIESGVKIYEYTPGFVHAKASVIDGVIGSVGTVNLDYRSLFLHFENNSVFYKSDIIKDIEKDFLKTQQQCVLIKTGENLKMSLGTWFLNGVLRIFSPLC